MDVLIPGKNLPTHGTNDMEMEKLFFSHVGTTWLNPYSIVAFSKLKCVPDALRDAFVCLSPDPCGVRTPDTHGDANERHPNITGHIRKVQCLIYAACPVRMAR